MIAKHFWPDYKEVAKAIDEALVTLESRGNIILPADYKRAFVKWDTLDEMPTPPHSLHLLRCRLCRHKLPGMLGKQVGHIQLPLPGMRFAQCGVIISFILCSCTSLLALVTSNLPRCAVMSMSLLLLARPLFLGVSLWPAAGTGIPHSTQNFAPAPGNLPQRVQTRTLMSKRPGCLN